MIKNLFSTEQVNLSELIANGATIVDVRSRGEFQGGHLKNSVNIPLDQLGSNVGKLSKAKPIITCCASGMRSSSAVGILKSKGFNDVYNGGSWLSLRKYE